MFLAAPGAIPGPMSSFTAPLQAMQIPMEALMSEPGHSDKKNSPGSEIDHPEMMGDETEEQNLGQPGRRKARISEQEVEEAFGEDELNLTDFWMGLFCVWG